jgi:hypothetical protein
MFLLALFQLVDSAVIVTELDYECTDDSIRYKEMLSKYKPLDDVAVSKWLGSVVGTQNGEARNIDVLVNTVIELVSS